MSRKFSNVLVICALVCVAALLITGTTLAVYHSIGNTVNAYTVFVDGETSENDSQTQAYANVSCDDTTGAEISVSKGHTTTATLSAVYFADAYSFVGWFEGDKDAYNSAYTTAGSVDAMITAGTIRTGDSIEVSMAEDSSWCAVYKVKKYSISYSYTALDDSAVETAATSVVYGAELETLTGDTQMDFVGWTATADGTALDGKFFYAQFGSAQSVVLSNPFEEHDYSNEVVTAAIEVVNSDGEEISDAEYTSSTVTFKLDDTAELSTLLTASNWTAKYSFWTVDNLTISYNGTTYTNEETSLNSLTYAVLSNATEIADGYENVTLSVVPTITKNLSTITFTEKAIDLAAADSSSVSEDSLNNPNSGAYVYKVYYAGLTYEPSVTLSSIDSESGVDSIWGAETFGTQIDLVDYNVSLRLIRLVYKSGDDECVSYVEISDSYGTTLNDVIQYLYDTVWIGDAATYYGKTTAEVTLEDVLGYLTAMSYTDDGSTLTLGSCDLFFVTAGEYIAA